MVIFATSVIHVILPHFHYICSLFLCHQVFNVYMLEFMASDKLLSIFDDKLIISQSSRRGTVVNESD